jgi:hypothetical protein
MTFQQKSRGIMKNLVMMTAFAISIATVAVAQQPTAVKLSDGTIVSVAIAKEVDSSAVHQGDIVAIEAAQDVVVNNVTVIKKGASGTARVEEVNKKGGWGKSGGLRISINYVQAVDGTNVRLHADMNTGGGGPGMGSAMMGLSGGLHKGKDAKIPQGTLVNAYVDGNQSISVGQ